MKKGAMILVAMLGVSVGLVSPAGDFDGDGTADIAILRQATGLWAVRGITRLYFGGAGDAPVDGDYEGTGTDIVGIFRSSNGLWAIRGLTRVYFGQSGDGGRTGDYNGDGTEDIGLFRGTSGLWAVRGVTRAYFGAYGDFAVKPDMPRVKKGIPLKTGQFTEYTSGDDGSYQKGLAFSYQTADPAGNGEIVTIDNVTGLMWASDGLGKGCWFQATGTWDECITWANGLNFAGYNDWRLPNIRELQSLVNYAQSPPPTINQVYFPNTVLDYYWSSTAWVEDTGWAWVVNFDNGNAYEDDKYDVESIYVRAVRGGE